jgi:hypothetical protein
MNVTYRERGRNCSDFGFRFGFRFGACRKPSSGQKPAEMRWNRDSDYIDTASKS